MEGIKLKKHFIYISLILIVVALFVYFGWTGYSPDTEAVYVIPFIIALLIASLVFLVLWTKHVTSTRVFTYGLNTIVMVMGVIGILILINFISYRQNYREDFTENQKFSLSDQTDKVLAKLDRELNIIAFYQDGDTASRTRLEDLMEEYTHLTDNIKYEFVDPVRNPNEAMQYGVKQLGVVVLEFPGGGWYKITTGTLEKLPEGLDITGLMPLVGQELSKDELTKKLNEGNFSSEEIQLILACAMKGNNKREKLSGELTEEGLTNAIMNLLQDQRKVVYFLSGHNEASLSDSLTVIKDDLEKETYEVKELFLLKDLKIPEDCNLLIIAGPEKKLEQPELDAINTYLEKGGKLMVMVDPMKTGLEEFLLSWNVEVFNDLILDFSGIGQIFQLNEVVPVAADYPEHEITKDMQSIATGFPIARSLSYKNDENNPERQGQILVQTLPNTWSYRGDLELNMEPEIDPARDVEGPLAIAVAVTVPVKEDKEDENIDIVNPGEDDKPEDEARIIVIGNSSFIQNQFVEFQGNADLFLNMVNWLTEQEDLISIRPKDSKMYSLDLTPSKSIIIFLLTIIMFPLLLIVTGVAVWLYRR